MMAMVDNVTGMVYWVPAEYQAPIQPPFTPVVMPYRYLRPAASMMAPMLGPAVNTTVFVRGIPRESTTQTVEAHFKIYGEVASCHVIRHKDASTNKGIAFVKFHDHAAAQLAIRCNSPGVMDQREILAEWAHPKPATSASRPLPDQPIAPEYVPLPNLVLAPPPNHLVNSPSFFSVPSPLVPAITFNAHLPWQLGASTSGAPYRSYGGHVVGFPHPGFAYGQETALAVPSPNYYPAVEYSYYPGGGTSASGSGTHQSEGVQRDRGNSTGEDSPTPCQSFDVGANNRKGREKEHSNNS